MFFYGNPFTLFRIEFLWAISSLVEIGLSVAEYEVVKGVVFSIRFSDSDQNPNVNSDEQLFGKFLIREKVLWFFLP